ncbi:hypothetical protein EZ313_17850 [Ramlibacter henchirensis]|uniref:Uncharacterized protein n=1 Tax=Ramlibacter henchirensis TaxID=204072 RepID=A0A4Z0BUS8_9BURK|nr:hypothetical protein [Ramlibacter henchirensis]TFZ03077.1 hypothetical protein EZ313_17850 [Ramlibacter henchirensis]
MTKGKSKTGGRSGSDSSNASRASASDRKHDKKKMQDDKSIKLGTEQSGKMKDSQGGAKRENDK